MPHSGYKRDVADKKQTGEMSQQEGKSALTMSSYVALCLAMLTAGNDCAMHLFAHTFLVLSWVLVCRSVSTATINFAHIGASDDCILINLPRSKCDQDGDRAYERAVYANPFRPEVCLFAHSRSTCSHPTSLTEVKMVALCSSGRRGRRAASARCLAK